jgi:hypothetical protein
MDKAVEAWRYVSMEARSWAVNEPPQENKETIVSSNLSEFVSHLSLRTKVPSHRLEEYLTWPDQEVRQEVQTVSKLLRRLSAAVVSSMEDTASIDAFWQEVDLKAISRDHDWRSIFSSLRHAGLNHVEHKRAVLVKYLQYLTFRKRLLELICLRKPDSRYRDEAAPRQGPTNAVDDNRRAQVEARSSLIVEHPNGRDFVRLPLGEPIQIPLPAGRELKLMLAGHMFRVVGATPPILVDQHGVTYFLKEGKNMLGRHPQNDIVANPDFRDISRAHLLIEWQGNHAISLTDVSSRGTFIAIQHLMPVPKAEVTVPPSILPSFAG